MFTLICGLPNSGKTTYSSNFTNVIHADDYRRTKEMIPLVENADDVCVEGLFLLASQRKKLCDAYNGKKVCIWIDVPMEECIKRENRGRPQVVVKSCHRCFEPPTYEEGWDEIICQK